MKSTELSSTCVALDGEDDCAEGWIFYEGCKVNGVKVQADISSKGDFWISHRPHCFNLSHEPSGLPRTHVGTYGTLEEAMAAADERAGSTGQ